MQLNNFLLATAAPSRRACSSAQAILPDGRSQLAVVGAGDDVFSADEFSERVDTIDNELSEADMSFDEFRCRSGSNSRET